MNKKRIVGVALAVGACGVLAAAGMMLSKKSGAVVLDQAGNEIAKLILQDGKISYECEDKYQSYADIVSQEAVKMIQEREGVNEKTAAKILAEAAGADIYEIKPEVPYTKADLDWMDKSSRSTIEMQDKSSRPAIADKNADISAHDTIFVGFPIWWYIAPTIINTFLESYDFSGKTIILFATSGGSGFGKTVDNLKCSVSDSTVIKEGKLLNGRPSVSELQQWVESLGV